MRTFSTVAKIEKNKLANTAPFLLLVKIDISASETIRLINNNEEITWDGFTWYPFPMQIGDFVDDTKQLPSASIDVSNVEGSIQAYLEEYDGLTDKEITIYVVHANNLASNVPEMAETFSIDSVSYDEQWAKFTLGGQNVQKLRFPPRRYMQNFCGFKYKSVRCGAVSDLSTCPRTLAGCRERNNSTRFGGEPGMLVGGLYAN